MKIYIQEFQDKTITSVTFDYMEYIAVLEESANEIIESDDFEENMIDDCMVKKCYYKSAS